MVTQQTQSIMITHENYYQDTEYLSHSQFKDFLHCEELYRQRYMAGEKEEREKSAALRIGTAVDKKLTDPQGYEDAIWEGSKTKLTKEEKEAMVASGITTIAPAEAKTVHACVEEVERQELHKQFCGDGWESQRIFTAEFDGIKTKGMFDKFHKEKKIILDYKTTKDTITFNPAEMYATQLAWYRGLVKAEEGIECTCYICAVDKHKDYKRGKFYVFSEETLEAADEVINMGLKAFKETRKFGVYNPRVDVVQAETHELEEAYREEERVTSCMRCPHYAKCKHSIQKHITVI